MMELVIYANAISLQAMLSDLANKPLTISLLVFLVQNILIFGVALLMGHVILKIHKRSIQTITRKDIRISLVTVLINTLITQLGFHLYTSGYIHFNFSPPHFWMLADFLVLFFCMDLLMFLFHYIIHRTKLHRALHALHHEAVHPKPIDLFVLHPLETVAFGLLFISVLLSLNFHLYAVIAYLAVNVLFGIIGHLGFEPLSENLKQRIRITAYLGTSGFHHKHHEDIDCNFGFYTNIWDRLLGTFQDEKKSHDQ